MIVKKLTGFIKGTKGIDMETYEIKKKLMEDFSKEIPVDAVQIKDQGAKTEGYKIGYLIDILNKTTVENSCSWDCKLLPIEETTDKKTYYTVYKTEFSYKGSSREKTVAFIRMAFNIYGPDGNPIIYRESFGSCPLVNNNLGDTLKGAQTDALKKIMSYLGLGNAAFRGQIDNQMLSYRYWRNQVLSLVDKYIKSTNKEPTDSLRLKLIAKITKKAYLKMETVSSEDWKLIEITINNFLSPPKEEEKPETDAETSATKKQAQVKKNSARKASEDAS